MKKMMFVFAVAALAFTACKSKGKSGGWPESEKKAFVKNCEENGGAMGDKAKSYCSCMLGKVEAKYPDPKDAMGIDMASIMDMATDCLK
jgi:hypothetical protein